MDLFSSQRVRVSLMMNVRLISGAVLVATSTLSLFPLGATAQPYPTKPVRMIVPFPPGGGTEGTARVIAHALSEGLGQQVIVDNRPGATGRIGTEIVAKSPADGYTLLMGSAGPNSILPGAYSNLPYDAVRDFAPISLIASSDYVLVVHPSLPVKSVKDLVAIARSKRGQLNYASAGNMSVAHMSAELFKVLAKADMVHVPYKGGGPAITAALTGEVSLYFSSRPSVAPHAKSGRLRLVATTGAKRSKSFPELPTVGETLPGYAVSQWFGILAPAGTPREIITRLNGLIVKAVANPKVAQQLAALGSEPASNSPEEFAAYLKAEIAKWGKVVKTSGMPLE